MSVTTIRSRAAAHTVPFSVAQRRLGATQQRRQRQAGGHDPDFHQIHVDVQSQDVVVPGHSGYHRHR